MYCTQCKAGLPDNAKFCSDCGHDLTGALPQKEKSSNTPLIVAVIGLSLLVLILFWGLSNASNRSAAQNRTPSGFPMPFSQPRTATIANTGVSVAALSYSWFAFSVPERSVNVSVQGHFAATDGMGNDIQVYVLNSDEFANFKNHHQTTTYYNSQRETQNSINAVLPVGAGTYYLVLDNRFSLLTPKAVQISAVLNYTN